MGIPAWFDGDPLKVSRRAHVFIRTTVHHYMHNVPFFGVAERFSVSDRCQDVSSFVIVIFILIHGRGTVPSVVLGESRRRLRWSRDFVHTVLSFTFACAFLALVVGYTALVRFLELAISGHVTNMSAQKATCLLSIGFVLPVTSVAVASLRQGIDLHVGWSSPVVKRHCHACLILCVMLQELKSHCVHRFEGSHR